MSEEEIRIAIAEACGWKYIRDEDFLWLVDPNGRKRSSHGLNTHRGKLPWGFDTWCIPDYLHDLNACAEFEGRGLNMGDGIGSVYRYTEILSEIVERDRHSAYQNMCFANPKQRCEAFLRTIDKWEDQP